MFSIGNFVLSWHGFFSVVAMVVGVWMAGRAASRENLDKDLVYNTAIWGIIGGVIGARLVHVIDYWSVYSVNPVSIFQMWSGGIGLWGGILGGWLGGSAYGFFSKQNVGKLMDIGAASLLVGQTIGRIGDIINGEHCAISTDTPWGWFFTHPNSPGRYCIEKSSNWSQGYFPEGTSYQTPVHPAIVYEMIWNMIGFIIITLLRGRVRPDGSIFMIYLFWYSIGRFFVQFLRLDSIKFGIFQEAHIIAFICFFITGIFIIFKTRLSFKTENNTLAKIGTRSERRRKSRNL
tara:strand:- start:327 stop:1193 length:867 start_codon:yes stop_codon:yes gene_type:complete